MGTTETTSRHGRRRWLAVSFLVTVLASMLLLVSPASALGLAFGPVIAGVLIESSGYTAMYIAVGVALALYLACILPFAGKKS